MRKAVSDSKETLLKACEELGCKLPFSDDVSALCNPLTIGGKKAANRIVYQAMEGCDGTIKGEPDELTVRRYERFARGSAGIIWFEATAVQPEARANPRQMLMNSQTADSFRRILYDIKEIGLKKNGFEPIVIMQLTHSGRYSKPNGYPQPLIAYNNPLFEKENPISSDRILTDDQLDKVGEDLVKAAILAEQAGFDGVDIKSCHRYLLCELLSAYQREGRYGGSFENRTRLLTESVSGAIQSCSDNFLVTSRVNAYDGFPYPYGFGVNADEGISPDLSEAKLLAQRLAKTGAKLINISMGNPYVNPHVNRPFVGGSYEPPEHPLNGVARILNGTAEIQKAIPDTPVICSGLSYLGAVSANVAAAYIQQGGFAFAGYGRMTLAYPDLASDIISGKGLQREKCCVTCSKCTAIMRAGGTPGCPIRDKEVYGPIYEKYCK